MTTATASVPVSAQAIASPPTPVSSRSQSPNYLQRLVQDLDPKVAAHHKFCNRAFEVAQIVSLLIVPVLFGLAAGITIALALPPLAPILAIPLAIGISISMAVIGGFIGTNISNFLQKRAQEHEVKAHHLTALAERLRSLPQDPREIRNKLASMHIIWNRIPGVQQLDDLTRLKPLIALYDETIERQRRWERVAMISPSTSQNGALSEKIEAAFVHAVIQNPEFAGKLEDLARIDFSPSRDRSFLLFNNRNIQPITRAELSDDTTMPVYRLAERFVQAMTA